MTTRIGIYTAYISSRDVRCHEILDEMAHRHGWGRKTTAGVMGVGSSPGNSTLLGGGTAIQVSVSFSALLIVDSGCNCGHQC